MNSFAYQLAKADRLAAISQSVGFTLWQLQELEGVTAQYFVLLTQAKKGMGLSEGSILVEKALAQTFGATLHQVTKAGLVPPEIAKRFKKLLAERNWLVHHSRADSRNAIHNDPTLNALILRLEGIAGEALALLRYIGEEIVSFGQKHGISAQDIDRVSKQMLEQWHTADAL